MQLEFSASFEKPPIRSIRSVLETFAESMLRQTKFDEESGYYIVAHDAQNTLDLCRFASLFASTEHPICYFYALPGTQPFTDAQGEVHVPGRLVDYDIMEQYLAAHPEADLPSMDAAQPLKVAIDKETMQQMLDAMGMGSNEKGASRN